MEPARVSSDFGAAHNRFRAVVLPHLDEAHRLARYLTRSRTDSQDVVHEAIVRLLRYIESYRGGDSRTWVLQVVRNTTFTWLGVNRRRDHVPIEPHLRGIPQLTADPAAHQLRRSASKALFSAIEDLSHAQREVVILRDIKGLSYLEISTTLGIPIGTVMSRLSRAHVVLARRLRGAMDICSRIKPL